MKNEIGRLVFAGGPAIELDGFRGGGHGSGQAIKELKERVEQLVSFRFSGVRSSRKRRECLPGITL